LSIGYFEAKSAEFTNTHAIICIMTEKPTGGQQRPDSRAIDPRLEQRFDEPTQNLLKYDAEMKSAYGIEPYARFRQRCETYADLKLESDKCRAERFGEQWHGATPEEGTYSLDYAKHLYSEDLHRIELGETYMREGYNKQHYVIFVGTVSVYADNRQAARRHKAYIDREESKRSQTPPQE
jgi:hypothetical protein